MIVRGPGIAKGKESHIVSSHHDLAPTFLALARGDEHIPSWVDGGVIPLTKELENHPKPVSKESFAVEFWSKENYAENYFPIGAGSGPNTYKTVRVIAQDYNCKLYNIDTHEGFTHTLCITKTCTLSGALENMNYTT